MTAGVFAALASATRIVGCTLIVVLLIEMYIDSYKKQEVMSKRILYTVQDIIKDGRKLLSLALCPLGIFVYMTFLKNFCGDAWAFYHVQRAWRTQKLFPVIGVLYKSCTGQLGSMSDSSR